MAAEMVADAAIPTLRLETSVSAKLAVATIGRKVAAVLEAIPVHIKRRSKNLTAEDIEIITAEITKARNIAALAQLDQEDDDGLIGDSQGDTEWPEEP